jgi:hypothetical protein
MDTWEETVHGQKNTDSDWKRIPVENMP